MIEQFVDPYNRKDLDALVALYHPDAELSFFMFPPQRGLDAIRAIWQWDLTAFPDGKLKILRQLTNGSTDMVEWTWTGTNLGPITLPSGETLSPTGRQATVMGMDTVEFESSLITAHRLYFQELSIMTQMGLIPSPGAAPA
jgi:hypothetical protein